MIRIRQIRLKLDDDFNVLKKKCAKRLHLKEDLIKELTIYNKSLDARHKPDLYWIYTVDVLLADEEKIMRKNSDSDIFLIQPIEYNFSPCGDCSLPTHPIIVGTGPAGLFCGYLLAELGYQPYLIERGQRVEERLKTVETFWQTGILNPESNVQFGEGGAGTFSDGKLVSQVKDYCRRKKVFDTFISCGADAKISYENKPHIGTDKLCLIIKNMREKIIKMGGRFFYQSCLTDIATEDNKIKKIQINGREWIDTDVLVLALGHSARDTFEMLYNHHLQMEAKPFAVGVRIQHPQSLINQNQYGYQKTQQLEPASYKLTYKTKNNRGVYSFCMCPGGYVINASSEPGLLAINGMSYHDRDSLNANSALIVTISPDDFGHHPLDGMKFQRELEEKTYHIGQSKIPMQLYKDYKKNQKTAKIGSIQPLFKGKYSLANLNDIFPNYINESLVEAIDHFDKQIKGYANDDVILAAVESRTSSPLRILRDEEGNSSIKGIYPCGEGAGYAGGITSAAIDGIKVAEWIARRYKQGTYEEDKK